MLEGELLKLRQRIEALEEEVKSMKRLNSFPSTMLSDSSSYLNKNRTEGMFVWNETTKKPTWAAGNGPSDPWVTI